MTSTHPNLIITRAGPSSLHKLWLAQPRNFDLLVAAYDETAMAPDESGLSHILIRGPKVWGWRQLFAQRPDILKTYRQIALIDDDIDTTATVLSKCFDYGDNLNLAIWQPSLSWDSYFTYGFTLRNPLFKIRYVNYVEMMCPFFSREALAASAALFSLDVEAGVDLIWCSLISECYQKFAIIDDCAVRHTRPVGALKAVNGFASATYEDHIYRCLDIFGAKWPSCIAYSGVSADDRPIASQLHVALRTLAMAPAVARADWRVRLRPVSDHIRHQFFRKPSYIPNAKSRLDSLG